MKTEHFEILLEDLYTLYNKDHLQYIKDLSEKYSRHEFDAVQNVFIKYNNRRYSTYDPEMGTDKHIFELIKLYSDGKRPLLGLDLDKRVENKKEEIQQNKEKVEIKEKTEQQNIISDRMKEIEEGLGSEVSKKIKSIEHYLDEREKEIQKLYDKKLSELNKKIEELLKAASSGIEESSIKIISEYTESEIDFPNKREIAGLGIGARIVAKNKEGKFIGLEVKDILYDGATIVNGKTSIEIILDKG